MPAARSSGYWPWARAAPAPAPAPGFQRRSAPAPRAGDDEPLWLLRRDALGREFWHDRLSGEVTFDEPWEFRAPTPAPAKPARGAARWEKLWTRDGSACFYHDVDAGTVTWDEPDGYDPARDGGGRGDDVVVGDRCAWELLRTDDGHPFYHNVDTGEVTWDAPDDFDDASDHDDASVTWTRHRDSATGRDYYHNLDTGETTWERPEVEEEEDEEEEEEDDDDDEGWAMRAARHHYEGGVAHDEPTLHPADELRAAVEPIAYEPAERAEGRGLFPAASPYGDATPRHDDDDEADAPRRSSASKLFGVSAVAEEEEEREERRS